MHVHVDRCKSSLHVQCTIYDSGNAYSTCTIKLSMVHVIQKMELNHVINYFNM
jgi:hypothetical protein